jgi:hypothetical protein
MEASPIHFQMIRSFFQYKSFGSGHQASIEVSPVLNDPLQLLAAARAFKARV